MERDPAFGRGDGGGLETAEIVNLSALAREVLAEHQSAALAKRQAFVLEAPASGPFACTDYRACRALVDNLVASAVRFSPRYKRIDVRVRTDAGRAILEVDDEGPDGSLFRVELPAGG